MSYVAKVGNADDTMIEDLQGPAMTLYTPVWGSSYIEEDHDEGCLDFKVNGDVSDETKRVNISYQFLHGAEYGANSFFQLHFHHFQRDATKRTVEVQYRKVRHGVSIGAWTTLTVQTNNGSDAHVYSSGDIPNMTWLPEIDVSDLGLSDVIQFRFARTDSNSGDLEIFFIDSHIAKNSIGSTTISEK